MTDIVEQLREIVSKGSPFGQVMAEAADEIERQRRVISFKGRVDRLSGALAQGASDTYSFGTDYGKDLLTDINQAIHRGGTNALVQDCLKRCYREINRLHAAQPPAAPVETDRQKLLDVLPLQFQDGPDYCTVRDAKGKDFALTTQPDILKEMESALRVALVKSISHNGSSADTETEKPRPVKLYAWGGQTRVNDYLMSDGTVKAMTLDEAKAAGYGTQPQAAPVTRCDGADDLEHLDGMLDDRERG